MAINKRSEYSKAWQNKKIAKGLCGGCGKNKINLRSKRYCNSCLDWYREYSYNKSERKTNRRVKSGVPPAKT